MKPIRTASNLSPETVLKPKAGWYRGDLHLHTNASDGIYSPPVIVEMARAEGLDFVAITDHNTLDAFSELDGDLNLLVVPGMEVTFDDGDFNVFGIREWRGWMEQVCTGQMRVPLSGRYRTTTDLMRSTEAAGLLNSINHPLLRPWEWRYDTTDLRYVHCLEIWNDPYWPDNAHANPQAVGLWTAWLNEGYRITGIGGSDYHRPRDEGEGATFQRIGLPSTYVCAEELSVRAILRGLRQRRVYVSIGPRISFQALANGTRYEIGDDLGQISSQIEFMATVEGSPASARARIVKNGEILAEAPVQGGQGSFASRSVADPGRSDWYRLEVLDQNGQLLVITNPIFVGPVCSPHLHRYGDFMDLQPARKLD